MRKTINFNAQVLSNSDDERELVLKGPLSVCHSIIDTCNRKCAHCMSASTNNSYQGLSTEESKRLFTELNNGGVQRAAIVGGEPFLREDLVEIMTYVIEQLGMDLVVTTHGGFMTQELAEAMKALDVTTQVSLDGEKKVNDALRGRGNYEEAIRALRLLKEAGACTRISHTVQKRNQEELPHVLEIAKQVNAVGVYVNKICFLGRADVLKDRIFLSDQDQKILAEKVDRLRKSSPENREMLQLKKAERATVFIAANGDYYSQGKTFAQYKNLGNVLEDDIGEMWKETDINHLVHFLQFLGAPQLYR